MNQNLAKNETLQRSILQHDFILKTQQQIAKDFAKVNIILPKNFDTEPFSKSEIERFIANGVAKEMEKGERHLLQLLYAIDFSEKKFLELTLQTDFLVKIAEQILFREAYKVWLRQTYS